MKYPEKIKKKKYLILHRVKECQECPCKEIEPRAVPLIVLFTQKKGTVSRSRGSCCFFMFAKKSNLSFWYRTFAKTDDHMSSSKQSFFTCVRLQARSVHFQERQGREHVFCSLGKKEKENPKKKRRKDKIHNQIGATGM